MIIAIEGIDGSGKTTIANFLKAELEKLGYKVASLKEPTDSEWGMKVRESYNSRLKPEEELELFLKDREYDVKHNILPALRDGKIVIMDRYYLSTIAYQGALGFDPVKLQEINEKIAPKPDLTFVLDVPPEKSISRVEKRGDRPNDFERLEYLKKVRELFLWSKNAVENVVVINADRSIEEVKKEVLEIVKKRLNVKNSDLNL